MRLGLLFTFLIVEPAVAAPPSLPPHYAKLFQSSATWTYDVSETNWDYDKIKKLEDSGVDMSKRKWPKATKKSVMKCHVARVVSFANVIVSEVVCDKEVDHSVQVSGLYLADAKGLYRIGSRAADHLDDDTANAPFPLKEADLPAPADLAIPEIAAKPTVSRVENKEASAAGDGKYFTGVRRDGAAWCWFRTLSGASSGHNGTMFTCYGNGVASGGNDMSGELHEITFRAR